MTDQRLESQEIEDLITRIEHADADAMGEAENIIRQATSDDCKDRLIEELFALEEAMERFNEQARGYIL